MMSGDEFYDDEVTSGPIEPVRRRKPAIEPLEPCVWCEDWADGFDPEPCPTHSVSR